jgi:hypothetical protein
MNENRKFPNLFWPILFIGIGVYYLLANMGMIDAVNFSVFFRFWPVFLVVAGINMLFSGSRRWLASVLSGLLALLLVAFLFLAPTLVGSLPEIEVTTESFSEPFEDARSADVVVDFDSGAISVSALDDSPNLFEAEVRHNHRVDFSASGGSDRNIRLRLDAIAGFGDWFESSQTRADISLAPDVPTDLTVDIGSGSTTLDLTALTLTDLMAGSGSGSIDVALPGGTYPAEISSGSGGIIVETAEDAVLDLGIDVGSGRIVVALAEGNSGQISLDSGSGSVTLVIPEGLAIQLRGDTGSGSVNLPAGFTKISGDDDFSGESGVWETPGFAAAVQQLIIRFDLGSGSLRVSYP